MNGNDSRVVIPFSGRGPNLPPPGEPPYGVGMEARVAVLEQIAKDTKEILGEIKRDIRDIRQDQKVDFRVLFGALISVAVGLAAIMAHGFKWF